MEKKRRSTNTDVQPETSGAKRPKEDHSSKTSSSANLSSQGDGSSLGESFKVFDGNKDSDSIIYHQLHPPILARYIRLRPTAWNNHISLRMELYGCIECAAPLGMGIGLIKDAQITASSELDANHAAIQGRLNFQASGEKQGAWSSRTNDVNQWIQVDFLSYTKVTGIATQGRNGHNQWVTKYKLEYSDDGVTFHYYKAASPKVFNDSVHGHIELHPLLVKIIDTPQFQRLRNIKQLGGCYFVYPSASHNRFEHCIGTSYLAGKLVKKLQKRQPNLGITDEDVLCVQIAGLCHDLGHGPFSHMFDAQFIPEARPGREWKHENASIDMFDHMIKENDLRSSFKDENLKEPDLNFIKGLIEGKESQGTDRGPEKSFLYEIVANKRTGIDVDKFDYFARDCHGLGINNSFDHKRYIKFARVIFVKGKGRQICLRDKEVNNIYGLFQTRNSLHREAYKHKTCNIIEKMITEAFLKADKSSLMKIFQGKEGKLSMSDSIDDMKAYTRLTDHVYYHILNFADDDFENIPDDQQQQYLLMKEARDILMRVEKRDLYKWIGQTILREERTKDTIPMIPQEIAKCVASRDLLKPDDFVVDIVKFSYGMGYKNPIEEVGFYEKREPDKAVKIQDEEVSEMLPKTFAEQEMRVYFKRVDDNDLLKKAEECFEQWCKGQTENCTTPKGGDGLADRTPEKPHLDVQKIQKYPNRAIVFKK